MRFARACTSQAVAMQVLAAVARGRPACPLALPLFGVCWRFGQLDGDEHINVVTADYWGA
jgi:hypothetical protein